MQSISKSTTLTTGLAMFAMLFGAGNIVFALAIGQYAQDKNLFAILGLLMTAVGVPFLGLISMTLFDGDYRSFFDRIGKYPGFIVAAIVLALIGPFGAIPRCIALSYSTSQMYLPDMSLPLFSVIACLFIFAFTIRRTSILDLIGYVLTPLKLGTLIFLIVKGFIYPPEMPVSLHTDMTVFLKGLKEGYQTMDLLGCFFFCSVVLDCLRKNINVSDPANYRKVIMITLKASCIGAGILAAIYIGFSYVAAFYSGILVNVPTDQLIGLIAVEVLGPYASIFVGFTVTLACMTTAIALSTVFAEFIHKDLSNNRINYPISLIITLVLTYFISILHFTGISQFLAPILQLCYPALIVLSIVNILYKLYEFKPVKVPVLLMFIISAIGYFM